MVLLAIFLRRPALELGRQSAGTADEDFQIRPRPVINFVRGFRRRGRVARLAPVTPQQEVGQLLFLGDGEFRSHTSGRVSVLTTDDNHLTALLNPLTGFLLPVSGERFFDGVVANLEWAVVVLGLSDQRGAQKFVVVAIEGAKAPSGRSRLEATGLDVRFGQEVSFGAGMPSPVATASGAAFG